MNPDDELKGRLAGAFGRWQIRFYTDSVLVSLLIPAAYIGGVIYLIWFTVHEVREEIDFYDKYGSNWREMYQKYHGSLSHAHIKIAVCIFALIAVGAILVWFYRQTVSRKSQRRPQV
jgi:hypothetical protein